MPYGEVSSLIKKRGEKNHPGISGFVHVPIGTNLDAGTFDSDNGWVRFGLRHNDIRPRIGDLLRFELGFASRPTVKKAIAKEVAEQTKLNSFCACSFTF